MGIPFLADNLIFRKKEHRVNILSIPSVIKTIRKSLLDGSIWPDFTVIPNRHAAILNLIELRGGHSVKRRGYTITPYPVSHSVPATGYLVEDSKGRRFLYTGDTRPTETIWGKLREKQLHCLIIETSFPNRMEEIAIRTGHLTPRLLGKELQKIENEPEKIFVTHLKPPYFNTIRKELQKLKIKNLKLLRYGEIIRV
jgi:cAMP phosphodiesterase